MRKIYLAIFMVMPSSVKISLLRMMGHKISKGCRIGVSWLDVKSIRMEEDSRIGSFNVFKGMNELVMGRCAGIGKFNQFTANKNYAEIAGESHGKVCLDDGAVITMRHYFDCQSSIRLGKNSLIAGLGTVFFTHQKGLKAAHEAKLIDIGERVYLGSSCVVLPGARISGYVYVVSGSLVSGSLSESHAIYSSPRAALVKRVDPNAPFFSMDKPTARF